jgi:hypothetical protein
MTIRSSASTQRWTNRERLDKEQDSRHNNSRHEDEQNDRFPARILPTHYETRACRYRKCKCCGGKQHLNLIGSESGGGVAGDACVGFGSSSFGPSGFAPSDLVEQPFVEEGKASPSYAIVRDARGC